MSKLTGLFAAFALAVPVLAAAATPWTVKIGGSVVVPDKDTGMIAKMQSHVSTEYNFTPSIEYTFGETPFSAELLLATPFKHEVRLDGAGKVVTFRHLPPTFTVKYNLNTGTGFTPYVGLGGNATIIWDEKTEGALAGTKVKADPSFGFAGQVGFNYLPTGSDWGAYMDVRYAQIESDIEWQGNDVGTLKVNPWVYTVGISRRF
jgi:outer membrane protein